MSDQRLRAMERDLPADKAAWQARYLHERERAGRWECHCALRLLEAHPNTLAHCPRCAGLPWRGDRGRLELLAYCGHAGARELRYPLRESWSNHDGDSFANWTRGLAQWGDVVAIRAALAAAECVMASCETCGFSARRALDACAAWLAEPTAERRCRSRVTSEGAAVLPDWAYGVSVAISGDQTNGHPLRRCLMAITDAARVAGEAATREAICAALIGWVLA